MNRIYQGKVTNVEIANSDRHAPHILSASNQSLRSREREKVAQPDEGRRGKTNQCERTEVRCRNQNPWLPFADDPKQAKAQWQAALWQHHQLFQEW